MDPDHVEATLCGRLRLQIAVGTDAIEQTLQRVIYAVCLCTAGHRKPASDLTPDLVETLQFPTHASYQLANRTTGLWSKYGDCVNLRPELG